MFEKVIEEIRETAKGSPEERCNRLEIAVQEIKKRIHELERLLREDDA